ncbi:MAG: IPT/TIG domain-containing protein [Methanoregula sp.]|nr:IPT/TIG domain-containing protein [Methanoregula sp.]
MIKHFWYGVLISLFLICGVFIAGCSDQSPAVNTTPLTTTAANNAKFAAGDIIARTTTSTDQVLYVILKYDRSTDQYTRQLIYKNSDGSWGHFVNNVSEKADRSLVEKVYPVKIAHVTINTVAVVTPTIPPTVTITVSGNSPSITSISPKRGGAGATVSVTITGNYFQNGATAKLMRAGDPFIQATGVSVSSSTTINCVFRLTDAEKGAYNVVVTNPDGQSDTLVGGFTVGEPAPVISSITPVTGIYDQTINMIINGQYFKIPVKVSLTKGSDELATSNVNLNPDATKITCNLYIPNGTATGDWNVTVTNVEDGQSTTWNHPFKVNAT